MVKNKLCFVIMPFSSTKNCTEEDWTDIFENVHKSAIRGSKNGYKCERSNIRTGAFIKDILMQLNQADVVLADLTDMNPNVLYELGVRHTLRNRTILVSQTIENIPSDLIQYGVIKYDTTTPKGVAEYKKEISKILTDIKNDPDRSDNPVSDYLHQKNIVNEQLEAKAIEKKLIALISECSFNLSVIDEAILFSKKTNNIISRFKMGALELLITTYYIYPDEEFIKNANDTISHLIQLNELLNIFNDGKLDTSKTNLFCESFSEFKGPINYFMKQTNKILKDFRNQNFIEPTELAICVRDDKHKELLEL